MTPYRSKETHLAVQYLGEPIADVTCSGVDKDRQLNGCDSSRAHLPHVHTAVVGGMSCLKSGDWIMPVAGGPFCVVADGMFRSHFEVPYPDEQDEVDSNVAADAPTTKAKKVKADLPPAESDAK